MARLSNESWLEIRNQWEQGESIKSLSIEYEVSRAAIQKRIKSDQAKGHPWVLKVAGKAVKKPKVTPKVTNATKLQGHDKSNVVGFPHGLPIEKTESGEQGQDIKAIAAKHGQDAINVLVALMKDEEQLGSTRLLAADRILDRAFGKPIPFVEIGAGDEAAGESEDDRTKRENALKKALDKATLVKQKMLERSRRLKNPTD